MQTITRSCFGAILLISLITHGYGQKSLGLQNQLNHNSSEIPIFSSEKEKTNWIQEHPEVYSQYTNGNVIVDHSVQTKPVREKAVKIEKVIISNDSSFPTYIETGNKQLDDANYATKKAQWIESNKAKYNAMSATKSNEDAESIRAKEQKVFNNQKN